MKNTELQDSMLDWARASNGGKPDLVCLSHLRWGFVYQRPQHLMSRFARERRVFFFEEPVFHDGPPRLAVARCEKTGVFVATPHIRGGAQLAEIEAIQRGLLERMFEDYAISERILWYYTPMALGFARHCKAAATVYDCMDELSLFKGAPPDLLEREAELLKRADLVFTGGQSLYEAKRKLHTSVHAFPSSVDADHFRQARASKADMPDQANIPRPRIGYCGVIDERMDTELLREVASLRPDWQLILLGPIVKIDRAELPDSPNVHLLGGKSYDELPKYMAGWDVAMMPFARNDATRFISPTKTPEYLCAGLPVVSTTIRDVARPYGEKGLVRIADTPEDYVRAIEAALVESRANPDWVRAADEFLAQTSWDKTWSRMCGLIRQAAREEQVVKEVRIDTAPVFTPGLATGD